MANGNLIFDSVGLAAVATLVANEQVGGNIAGSGSGFSTVQTVPNSGTTFTITRGETFLCSMTALLEMTAGAENYCEFYVALWSGGTVYQRNTVSGGGPTTNSSYWPSGTVVFADVPAGTYEFRQEFALDAGTTAGSITHAVGTCLQLGN